MAERIHVLLDPVEKEQFRQLAAREGKSLSEWLRTAAREKMLAEQAGPRLDTTETLRDFFAECDRRETGREPDWDRQREIIERSIASGKTST